MVVEALRHICIINTKHFLETKMMTCSSPTTCIVPFIFSFLVMLKTIVNLRCVHKYLHFEPNEALRFKFNYTTKIMFRVALLFTVAFTFKLDKSEANSFLSRSKRNYELSADFEAACIEQTCDVVTFFEVSYFNSSQNLRVSPCLETDFAVSWFMLTIKVVNKTFYMLHFYTRR